MNITKVTIAIATIGLFIGCSFNGQSAQGMLKPPGSSQELQRHGVLSITKNENLAVATLTAGSLHAKISSFVIAANNYENMKITNIQLAKIGIFTHLDNVSLESNGLVLGVAPSLFVTPNNFNVNFEMQAGTQKIFDVYADIPSGQTGTVGIAVTKNGTKAVGSTSHLTLLFPAADVNLQINSVVNYNMLTISKSAISPQGSIPLGATEKVLASFKLSATPTENVQIRSMMLDLSSNSNATGPQNTTGIMECVNGASCDLTGTIKVKINNQTILSTSASPANVANLWNINLLAPMQFASFYTIPAGTSVVMQIVGNLSSNPNNIAPGETIQVGVKNLLGLSAVSNTSQYASSGNLVQGNIMTAN